MVHGEEALKSDISSSGAFFKAEINELGLISLTEFLEHFKGTEIVKIKNDSKLTVSGLV